MIRLAAACFFLWIAAVPDLKTRRIPLWIPGAFAPAAVAADLTVSGGISAAEIWAGAIPGVVLLILSFLLRGRIGEGDGLCLGVCGLITGFFNAVVIAETALLLASLISAAGLLTGKRRAGDRIAFVPFLAAASTMLFAARIVLP